MLLKEESTHEKYAEFQRKTGTQHITVPDTHGDDARQHDACGKGARADQTR